MRAWCQPLALCDYAARSASWALQGATGDPLAEQVHAALQHHPGGLTRSQISDILQHNRPATDIQRALAALALAGRATRAQIRHRRAPRRTLDRRTRAGSPDHPSPSPDFAATTAPDGVGCHRAKRAQGSLRP
jgi:hypothetical protein